MRAVINRRYRKAHKDEINAYNKKYYREIYEECERGVVKGTLIHLIFDFLNNRPSTELKELYVEFYEYNLGSVEKIYGDWVRITYEKYVKAEEHYIDNI